VKKSRKEQEGKMKKERRKKIKNLKGNRTGDTKKESI
jgi:hypothetical protein